MQVTKFAIDTFGQEVFDGFTKGETWNGWACPYFTLEQAQRIVVAHTTLGNKAAYDETKDSFSFHFSEDEIETFSAEIIDGRKLYPIGARNWIWEEINQEFAS
jgi:hypothetical protein